MSGPQLPECVRRITDTFMLLTLEEVNLFVGAVAERGILIQVATIPYEMVHDAPAHQDSCKAPDQGTSFNFEPSNLPLPNPYS